MVEKIYTRTFEDREHSLDVYPDPVNRIMRPIAIVEGNKYYVKHWTYNLTVDDILLQYNKELWDPADWGIKEYRNVRAFFLWGHFEPGGQAFLRPTDNILGPPYGGVLVFGYAPPFYAGYTYAQASNELYLFYLHLITWAECHALQHRLDNLGKPYSHSHSANPGKASCVEENHAHTYIFNPPLPSDLGRTDSTYFWGFENDRQFQLFLLDYGQDIYPNAGETPHTGCFLFGDQSSNGGHVYWITKKWYFKNAGKYLGEHFIPPYDYAYDTWEWRGEYYLHKTTIGNRAGYEQVQEFGLVYPVMGAVQLKKTKVTDIHLLRHNESPVLNIDEEKTGGKLRNKGEWGL